MNNESEDTNLKKDVKDFVDFKFMDVKSVDDLLEKHSFKINNSKIKSEKLDYQQLFHLKKVLQLTLNIYNNPGVYKDLSFNGTDIWSTSATAVSPLEHCYRHDRTDDLCTFVKSPTTEDVVKALYNYLVCLLPMEMCQEWPEGGVLSCPFCNGEVKYGEAGCGTCDTSVEDILAGMKAEKSTAKRTDNYNKRNDEDGEVGRTRNNIREESKEKADPAGSQDHGVRGSELGQKKPQWRCGKCDCLNECGLVNCMACDSLFEYGKWECEQCGQKNDCVSGQCGKCGFVNISVESGVKKGDKTVVRADEHKSGGKGGQCAKCGEKLDDCACSAAKKGLTKKDQWKCGKCGFYNEYKYANCLLCTAVYREGTWVCEYCEKENEGDQDHCGGCARENIRVKVRGTAEDVGADTWTCAKCGQMITECVCAAVSAEKEVAIMKDQWKCGKCGLLQPFDVSVCGACDTDRVDGGLWSCGSCTLVNKCSSAVCVGCYKSSEHLRAKTCEYCRSTKVREGEVRCDSCARGHSRVYPSIKWQCGLSGCGELNETCNKHCRKCHLERYFSHYRGDSVKILGHGEMENEVWICCQCCTFNSLVLSQCRKCSDTRYKKVYCWRCLRESDGTLPDCANSHRGW